MSAHTKTQLKCMRIQFKVGVQALTIWARRALHSALLLSPAEVLVLEGGVLVLLVLLLLKVLLLHLLVLKWDLFTNPLSLYGRRVRRTGMAGGTGTP